MPPSLLSGGARGVPWRRLMTARSIVFIQSSKSVLASSMKKARLFSACCWSCTGCEITKPVTFSATCRHSKTVATCLLAASGEE